MARPHSHYPGQEVVWDLLLKTAALAPVDGTIVGKVRPVDSAFADIVDLTVSDVDGLGRYRASYDIPVDAAPGEYVLLVRATAPVKASVELRFTVLETVFAEP